MKSFALPLLLLAAIAVLLSPWATASLQDPAPPVSGESQLSAFVGSEVVVYLHDFYVGGSSATRPGTLLSADPQGMLLQKDNIRYFVPQQAIKYVVEIK